MRDCSCAGCNLERNHPLPGETNSYWPKNLYDAYQFPLSESVAPPGTAWGAEGLRGNEANENKSMVLDRAQARKGESRSTFAQEDMTLSFQTAASLAFRTRGNGVSLRALSGFTRQLSTSIFIARPP